MSERGSDSKRNPSEDQKIKLSFKFTPRPTETVPDTVPGGTRVPETDKEYSSGDGLSGRKTNGERERWVVKDFM